MNFCSKCQNGCRKNLLHRDEPPPRNQLRYNCDANRNVGSSPKLKQHSNLDIHLSEQEIESREE